MRIMMLSWEYPPRIVGGIARVVHDLSHNFAKQGHEGRTVRSPIRAAAVIQLARRRSAGW
jgi:glycosyltransferase involved in cell wall biosynthesis